MVHFSDKLRNAPNAHHFSFECLSCCFFCAFVTAIGGRESIFSAILFRGSAAGNPAETLRITVIGSRWNILGVGAYLRLRHAFASSIQNSIRNGEIKL
ncbi:hypothetical protein [Pararhizobium polonicum]|uniref:hypothetical protein n=1 Tax=Pararhizobium polonicum TaxID=1612624 RepID=UPI001112688E|nr:hypothetical protein [Pararhizobium polonicum]